MAKKVVSWFKHEEGFQRRYNMLISEMFDGTEADEIEFGDDQEREWYIRAKKEMDDENERIRKDCEKLGIPAWKVEYEPMELD